MSACTRKHIADPISDEEWACPNCGAGPAEFAIWDPVEEDCDKIHPDDYASCTACGKGWSMKTVISKWIKKNNMVVCPHCKGTGVIHQNDYNKVGDDHEDHHVNPR